LRQEQAMSRIDTNALSTGSSAPSNGGIQAGGLNDVDVNQFLNLMLTELQNQDPLNPTDNAALMEQIGQLRSITANDRLVSTLTNFSTTQELSMASSMIGKTVKAIDQEAKEVNGAVSSVSIKVDEKDRTKREVQVHVGNQIVDIKNIREIVEK
jgi:flagellar basal-body rod modification protein FlgD